MLGPWGERVIIVFVVMMQLGICTVFLNYAAENAVAVERYYATGVRHYLHHCAPVVHFSAVFLL